MTRNGTTDYTYDSHTYKGYLFIKSNYNGMWNIHRFKKSGEPDLFKSYGFARTLKEAKQKVDALKGKRNAT